MKAYVLTAASAFALGAGSAQLADFDAQASIQREIRETVSKNIPSDNPVLVGIWNNVDGAMCPDLEAKLGWDPGDCEVQPGTVLSITKGPVGGDDHVSTSFAFDGTWSMGAPQ